MKQTNFARRLWYSFKWWMSARCLPIITIYIMVIFYIAFQYNALADGEVPLICALVFSGQRFHWRRNGEMIYICCRFIWESAFHRQVLLFTKLSIIPIYSDEKIERYRDKPLKDFLQLQTAQITVLFFIGAIIVHSDQSGPMVLPMQWMGASALFLVFQELVSWFVYPFSFLQQYRYWRLGI